MNKKYLSGLISWKSLYKLVFIFIAITFLVIGYLVNFWKSSEIINLLKSNYAINVSLETYWVSFSIIINILIIIYFINTFFFYKEEGLTKITGPTIRISLACYATILIIFYWSISLPWTLSSGYFTFKALDWIITVFQNFVIPLSIIIYIVFTSNDKIKWNQFFSKKIFLIFLFPVAYYITLAISQTLKLEDYFLLETTDEKKALMIDILYNNYPFIAFYQKTSFIGIEGVATSIIFMLIFILSLILLVILYIAIFNYRYKIKNRRTGK